MPNYYNCLDEEAVAEAARKRLKEEADTSLKVQVQFWGGWGMFFTEVKLGREMRCVCSLRFCNASTREFRISGLYQILKNWF